MQRAARRRRRAWTRRASSAATAARRSAWSTSRSGRRARCSTTRACASCRRSTRSSARPRCWARSASSPTRSAPPTACSPCGTARARASTAPATRSSTATPTARRRTAACWWSPATTTAASRRRCRTRATTPLQSWHMPVVAPANVAEYLEFGLYGWALSRFSGNWVGFTALSEVVESGSTVDLDLVNARVAAWQDADDGASAATGYAPPAGRPALPLARPAVAEDRAAPARQARRGARLRARQQHRPPGRRVARTPRSASSPAARRTSTCMEVLRRLDISLDALAAAGVRLYKVGLTYPIEPTRIARVRARACEEILVDRGEGRRRRDAAARPVLQRRRAAGDRRQARRARAGRWCPRSASCGRRA